jgi:hypothetical protein
MRTLTNLAAALTLAACQPAAEAPAPEPTAAAKPSTLPNGTTLTYTRSNQDGTLPETIVVHVLNTTQIHVAKMVDRCKDAAYVTAQFDPATQEATNLVGGRLQRDSTQLPQAFIEVDAQRKLNVRVGDPASAPIETHDAPPAPWRIYDFDFAEFAVYGPRGAADFTFGMALAWPDGTSPLLRILGPTEAKFLATETRDGAQANRFRFGGPAFTVDGADKGGEAVFDAVDGHLIEANFARPNHTGYTDFRLVLNSLNVEDGPETWRESLAAHWRDCPPA